MPDIKYFFGWYKGSTKTVCCSWVEHDGIPIGPKLDFVVKYQIKEDEAEDLKALILKYPCPPEINST